MQRLPSDQFWLIQTMEPICKPQIYVQGHTRISEQPDGAITNWHRMTRQCIIETFTKLNSSSTIISKWPKGSPNNAVLPAILAIFSLIAKAQYAVLDSL